MESDRALVTSIATLRHIFVFGGDITPTETVWRSLRGTEMDKSGGCPSLERIQAAAVLYSINNGLTLVPSGGKTNHNQHVADSPTISAVMRRELCEHGVPNEQIIEESQAFNAWEQVINCARMVREFGWSAEHCAILGPFWQLGRVSLFLQKGEDRNVAALRGATLLSMERVLASSEPRWNNYFKDLYGTGVMRETIAKEAMGIGQLLTGHSPFFPKPFSGFNDPLSSV